MTLEEELEEHDVRHREWSPKENRISFLVVALCGETGELANLHKKDLRGDPGDRRAAMVEELADIANYTFFLAKELGVDLQRERLAKMKKVEERPEFKARMNQP